MHTGLSGSSQPCSRCLLGTGGSGAMLEPGSTRVRAGRPSANFNAPACGATVRQKAERALGTWGGERAGEGRGSSGGPPFLFGGRLGRHIGSPTPRPPACAAGGEVDGGGWLRRGSRCSAREGEGARGGGGILGLPPRVPLERICGSVSRIAVPVHPWCQRADKKTMKTVQGVHECRKKSSCAQSLTKLAEPAGDYDWPRLSPDPGVPR